VTETPQNIATSFQVYVKQVYVIVNKDNITSARKATNPDAARKRHRDKENVIIFLIWVEGNRQVKNGRVRTRSV